MPWQLYVLLHAANFKKLSSFMRKDTCVKKKVCHKHTDKCLFQALMQIQFLVFNNFFLLEMLNMYGICCSWKIGSYY